MPALAAIDIGANSVRLKIANLSGQSLQVVAEDREVTRLGASVFKTGRLSPEAMDHTIRVLRRFQRTVRAHEVEHLRIVATSPLRDATNAGEFVAWVYAAVGWKLEVVSGLEEGRLIHLGVLSKTRLRASRLLLIDLGGGSCELTISKGEHIMQMYSLPLGAVRLTGDFLAHDPPRPAELVRMREFIREEIAAIVRPITRARVEMVLATSGSAAAITTAGRRGAGPVSLAAVSRLAAKLERMDVSDRAKMPGIGTRRTEIIVAGAVVFAELMESCRLHAFRYSPLGLRDGMLAQMTADLLRGGSLRKRIEIDRQDALMALAHHYQVDLEHAQQVRKLVLGLFTALRAVHRLPDTYREWLSAAALMHEVGTFINHSGRHRHSRYIVASSEIFGFTPAERLLMANLVRYLGKSMPIVSDHGLQALGAATASSVPRAVGLLRLARALNQGRRNAVRKVHARIDDQSVELRLTTGRAGAPLELWAVAKEAGYFRRTFGRALSAEVS